MTALAEQIATARNMETLGVSGRVASCAGLTISATGLPVPVGSLCEIVTGSAGVSPAQGPQAHRLKAGATGSDRSILAEVIGFRDKTTLLMPLSAAEGLTKGQTVRHVTSTQKVAVGPALLGRVLDGLGQPSDGKGPLTVDTHYPLHRAAPDAMGRPRIDTPLSVGIRSINALLTPGCGQRMGVFAGTGVGKSILLGMMARHTTADVAVISLVGERGREVGEFIAKDLGQRGLERSVLVVSTSDQSPPLRVRACFVATAIAEYFRDQGANVLLLMDSVTRLAMAARQIGLAAGEPPATKGYPPSVFATLPSLLERSGRTERGSITGLYTVLVEGDDANEPVSDAVRGILDGHIWLSRRLANRGQYPAVSVLESISRVMPDVVDAGQMDAAQQVRRLMAVWDEIEDLVNIGAYATGTSAEYDLAIRMMPAITAFMKQEMDTGVDFEASRAGLYGLVEQIAAEQARLAAGKRQNAETPKRQNTETRKRP